MEQPEKREGVNLCYAQHGEDDSAGKLLESTAKVVSGQKPGRQIVS